MKTRHDAKQARPRKAGCGCSGLFSFLILLLIIGAIVGWPIYLDHAGTRAQGIITEKLESVRIHYGDWYRSFEVIATYSIPGQPMQHRAGCDVDEKTYDSLHRGDKVDVYYFANLVSQPFLPATHLSPCTTMASVSLNPALIRNLIVAFVAVLVILFLWRVLRIRIAAWLLLPWFCLTAVYLVAPHAEPEPQHPVSSTATVASITTVRTVGGMENRRDIPLQHPYQIVRLKFVPSGMDTPVTAIDKVDEGSIPNLQTGQNANIIYDSEHPRIARLAGGTRRFPGQAKITVILLGIAFVVLLVILAIIEAFFRLIGRPLFQVARANGAFRRRYRR